MSDGQSLAWPHGVSAGALTSSGQSLFLPSQFSATSQSSTTALHSAVDLVSAGQSALVPVQVSAKSHTPALALHSVVLGFILHAPFPSQYPNAHTSSGHSSFISEPSIWLVHLDNAKHS